MKVATKTLILLVVATVSACGLAPNERRVSRDDYGDGWPFTVEEGLLSCREFSSVVFTVDGTSYGVNGDARARGGFARLEPIQRERTPDLLPGDILTRLNDARKRQVFRRMVRWGRPCWPDMICRVAK